jgi:hypothetical protein
LRYGYSSADIRLGDFFGKKYQRNEDGVSACLLMSDRGKSLFAELNDKGSIRILDQESFSDCMAYQSNRDYPYWNIRNYAFDLLKSGIPLDKVIKKYRTLLPLGYQIKCVLKYYLSYLPPIVLFLLKRLIRNID